MGLFGKAPGISVTPMQGMMGGFRQADPNQFMPQFDAQTGGAIQQFATMPQPQRKGLFGRIFGDDPAGKLGNLASGFAKAQAYIDGDWGAAESIGQGDRAAQLAEQQRRASLEDWMFKERWQRENPMPKDASLPSQVQVAEWYRTATPEQRRAYDLTQPIITNGVGSTVVPRGSWELDNTPVTEDGYAYTPGPGGRANQANWKPVGGANGQPVGNGFRYP